MTLRPPMSLMCKFSSPVMPRISQYPGKIEHSLRERDLGELHSGSMSGFLINFL